MQRSSPLASTGLIRLDASITPPEAAPAPIMVWISSMKSTDLSRSRNSASTAFRRFSKSPRYFVPASRAPEVQRTSILGVQKNVSELHSSTMRRCRPSGQATVFQPRTRQLYEIGYVSLRRRTQNPWMVRLDFSSAPRSAGRFDRPWPGPFEIDRHKLPLGQTSARNCRRLPRGFWTGADRDGRHLGLLLAIPLEIKLATIHALPRFSCLPSLDTTAFRILFAPNSLQWWSTL